MLDQCNLSRRTFIKGGAGLLLNPLFSSWLTVPITIEADTIVRSYSVRVPVGTTVVAVLDLLGKQQHFPFWVRTDPTWVTVGGRLTHLGAYRDSTESQAPGYPVPTKTIAGCYWVVFLGLSTLQPNQLLNAKYLALGRFSVTTYQLGYLPSGNRLVAPRLYLKLTLPNGPF